MFEMSQESFIALRKKVDLISVRPEEVKVGDVYVGGDADVFVKVARLDHSVPNHVGFRDELENCDYYPLDKGWMVEIVSNKH